MKPKYKRILLKLSGEALAGEQRFGLNEEVVSMVVDQLVKVHEIGRASCRERVLSHV